MDLLDEIVWAELIKLLETPALIEAEIQRREKVCPSGSARRRREALEKETGRLGRQVDKMLDAYQEDLMNLEKLRERMPGLKDRQNRVRQELKSLDTVILNEQRLGQVSEDISGFLSCLQTRVKGLDVMEKQAIVRLLVKEVVVGETAVHIHHSIPVPQKKMTANSISYLLRTGRPLSVALEHRARRTRRRARRARPAFRALRG